MTTPETQQTDAQKKSIFLSITYEGTILEFNKECEKITGYLRAEVLHKNIKELLIPHHYLPEWNQLLALEKQHKTNETYDILLQNKQKQPIPMSITILSLNKKNDSEESFLLIGNEKQTQNTPFNNIILNEEINEPPSQNNTTEPQTDQTPSNEKPTTTTHQQKNKDTKQTTNHLLSNLSPQLQKKNKKTIRIKKLTPKKQKQHHTPQQLQHITDNKPKKQTPIIKPLHDTGLLNIIQPEQPKKIQQPTSQPHQTKQILPETQHITQPQQPIFQIPSELLQHYECLHEKIHQLEQKEKQLEEKNHLLEQKLQEYTTASNQTIPKPHLQQAKDKTQKEKISKKKTISFLPNPFSMKKDKDELQQKIKQLDEKEKQLHEFESQLLHDRKQYNTQIAQMTSWKEKLLSLESEIEKRRMDLLEHETMLTQQMKTPLPQQSIKEKTLEKESQPPFESIQQSAAIIQRGIIKQINNSFSKLLGFKDDEILEKSLFDFVSPEGLSEIEKYYLKRLKGNKESQYQTIFSTKSEDTIKATVRLQSTEYNGDTAEIAIIAIDNTDAEKSEQKK